MSTSESEEQNDSDAIDDEKRDHVLQLVQVLLHERYKSTETHPSKDDGIIFLCRILKHFLLNKDYQLYYNQVLNTLEEDYAFNNPSIKPLRSIFNAFECKRWFYPKPGADRNKYRVFSLNQKHKKFKSGVHQMQLFRAALKYGAWHYQTEKQLEKEQKLRDEREWQWVGEGKKNKENGLMYYAALSNGADTFRVNDVVQLQHCNGQFTLPWIARIIKFIDNGGDKLMILRWFYFWKQIVTEQLHCDLKKISTMSKKLKGTACARYIFEGHPDDNTQYSQSESVYDLKKKVYLLSEKSKHLQLVNCRDVFQCDWCVDFKKCSLVNREKKQIIQDEQNFVNREEQEEEETNSNVNHNSNNVRKKKSQSPSRKRKRNAIAESDGVESMDEGEGERDSDSDYVYEGDHDLKNKRSVKKKKQSGKKAKSGKRDYIEIASDDDDDLYVDDIRMKNGNGKPPEFTIGKTRNSKRKSPKKKKRKIKVILPPSVDSDADENESDADNILEDDSLIDDDL